MNVEQNYDGCLRPRICWLWCNQKALITALRHKHRLRISASEKRLRYIASAYIWSWPNAGVVMRWLQNIQRDLLINYFCFIVANAKQLVEGKALCDQLAQPALYKRPYENSVVKWGVSLKDDQKRTECLAWELALRMLYRIWWIGMYRRLMNFIVIAFHLLMSADKLFRRLSRIYGWITLQAISTGGFVLKLNRQNATGISWN